jgi:hypothetical protein
LPLRTLVKKRLFAGLTARSTKAHACNAAPDVFNKLLIQIQFALVWMYADR